MRIGIITIYDLMNYGNRLQNYAVTKICSNLGMESETLIIDEFGLKEIIKKYIFHKDVRHWNVKQESEEFYNRLDDLTKRKYDGFLDFTRKYFKIRHYRGNRISLKKINDDFDFFIAGSDQIWNPTNGHARDWEFISFASNNKKLCLSPSFGISVLPENEKKAISKYLNSIEKLSVREEAGAEIIEELTGRKAEVLVDPTLLITKEEWLEISQRPNGLEDCEYILTYFLGEMSENTKIQINDISTKFEYKVFNIFDKNKEELYTADPGNFIYLISNAKLVLTDSFHACVFSFIFGVPFLVYARDGKQEMMSRINTLLDKFSLQRKYADSGFKNEIMESDYQVGYEQLKFERKKAIDFLRRGMKIEELEGDL